MDLSRDGDNAMASRRKNPNSMGQSIADDTAAAFCRDCLEKALPEIASTTWEAAHGAAGFSRKDYSAKRDFACIRDENDGTIRVVEKDAAVPSPTDGGSPLPDCGSPGAGEVGSPVPRPQPQGFGRRKKTEQPTKLKLREHAPNVFAGLRHFWGLAPEILQREVSKGQWTEVASPGKGGSKMFFVSGLMLKSVSEAEAAFLKKLLPSYYEHVTTAQPSGLPKIFAWVTLSLKVGRTLVVDRYLVMNNVLSSASLIPVVYDIKGSSYGRESASPPDGAAAAPVVLKDNDLKGRRIRLCEETRNRVLTAMQRDAAYLQKQNVVDYSLLVGIKPGKHHAASDNAEASDPGYPSVPGSGDDEAYYLGIIDILQVYNSLKKFETAFKGMIADESMSIIPPDKYATRFVAAVQDLLDWETGTGTKKASA
ncbi:putative phosphatidylinositol 4-phosphate 5-kinase MSS4 [Diplonema papillatum]|nr:putative phosphatidylinositol 4-phosphate 5-kinase MSS4 [Diplonema papillatum]|eukprot:gene23003-35250_t